MSPRKLAVLWGVLMLSACAQLEKLEQAPAPNDTVTRLSNEMKLREKPAPAVVAKVDDRDSRIAALERENQRLKDEAAAAQDELARLRSRVAGLEQQVASLNGTIAERDRTIAERDREIVRLGGIIDQDKTNLAKAERGLVRALRPEIEKGNIIVDLSSDQAGLRLLINLASSMLFASGQDEVKPAGVDVLKRVGGVLKEYPEYPVQVAGHTDNVKIRGALAKRFPTNMELSKARATNAAHALEEGGVPSAKLAVEGYADTKPVADNATEGGRNKNRRIEVIVTTQK